MCARRPYAADVGAAGRSRSRTPAAASTRRASSEPVNVELVAGRAVERAATIGSNLGADLDVAEEAERTPRGGTAREIEMERPLPSPAEMEVSGGVKERGQLGEAVARANGRDPRKLLPDVLGGHRRTPSSASKRRLTPTPAEP